MWGFCVGFLFCYVLLYILSNFAIHLTRKRAGCFAFIVVWMSCYCNYIVALSHGALGWFAVCYRSCCKTHTISKMVASGLRLLETVLTNMLTLFVSDDISILENLPHVIVKRV